MAGLSNRRSELALPFLLLSALPPLIDRLVHYSATVREANKSLLMTESPRSAADRAKDVASTFSSDSSQSKLELKAAHPQ